MLSRRHAAHHLSQRFADARERGATALQAGDYSSFRSAMREQNDIIAEQGEVVARLQAQLWPTPGTRAAVLLK